MKQAAGATRRTQHQKLQVVNEHVSPTEHQRSVHGKYLWHFVFSSSSCCDFVIVGNKVFPQLACFQSASKTEEAPTHAQVFAFLTVVCLDSFA